MSPQVKSANRKQLMEAAAVEFARQGLEAANINRISVAAGLGKGTVYNYFSSKAELFLAVVAESCTRAADGAVWPQTAATGERLRADRVAGGVGAGT